MQNVRISDISAREILDSRGNPTLESRVTLDDGSIGVASVPSGASCGAYEAVELRDSDDGRFRGKGVLKAKEKVSGAIKELLCGAYAFDQRAADYAMIAADGTENKSNLGANAILSVSLALAKASAASLGMPLYRYIGGSRASRIAVPMMNLLNGGVHASNNVDIQEFMIVPYGFKEISDAIRAGSEIYYALRELLRDLGLSVAVGDEGGFAPDLSGDEEALSLLVKAIAKAGYRSDQVGLAIDAAASGWVRGESYKLPKRGKELSREGLYNYWRDLSEEYPILSIEDPFGEDDFDAFRSLTDLVGDRMLIVGDDLFVTNLKRLEIGISSESANAILIKPNQIGTLSEVLETVDYAARYGYRHILSHRSGETCDDSIADIAVATAAPMIKAGAPCRGERIAKYNRLMEISNEIGKSAKFGF